MKLRCPDLSLEKLNSLAITLNSLVIINKAMTKTCARYSPDDDQTKFIKAAFSSDKVVDWQTGLFPKNTEFQLRMDDSGRYDVSQLINIVRYDLERFAHLQ